VVKNETKEYKKKSIYILYDLYFLSEKKVHVCFK